MVDYFLIRHGHVDYTPPAQITAHNALTPLGEQMAEHLAVRCDDMDLQYMFISPFMRTKQTAAPVLARFPDLPHRYMDEFVETSIDDLAGFVGPEPPEDLHQWGDAHFAHGNKSMWQRVLAGWEAVQEYAQEQGLERVAILAHGGPINAIIRHHIGCSPTRLRDCWLELDFTSISCLRISEQGKSVRWLNDARHIENLPRE